MFQQGHGAHRWPLSAQWSGDNVQIGEDRSDAVRFDPDTHLLTAVRPGTATLTVLVNGVRASTTIRVTGRDHPRDH